jgi:hypothetical protein
MLCQRGNRRHGLGYPSLRRVSSRRPRVRVLSNHSCVCEHCAGFIQWLTGPGEATIVKLRKMRTTEDDEEEVGPASATVGRPAWMNALKAHAEEWLGVLPKVSVIRARAGRDLAESWSESVGRPRCKLAARSFLCPRGFHRQDTPCSDQTGPLGPHRGVQWPAQADQRASSAHVGSQQG